MSTAADNRFYREAPGSAVDDGGPAFPVPGLQDHADFDGMSLRDHYAGLAMQALISTPMDEWPSQAAGNSVSAAAFRIADAMLKARSA